MAKSNIFRRARQRAFVHATTTRTTQNQSGFYIDPNYTTNLCPNPSFETSLAGWTATDSHTALLQDTTIALYGAASMKVTTDGSVPGQGVFGPQGQTPPAAAQGSMVISLNGTGTLNVTAVENPGGFVLATAKVVLTGAGWQTVTLNNLLFGSFQQVYILVTTVGAQAVSFNVDGVMYSPETPAHPYIDGDQATCTWTGTPELSSSFQQFQFNFSATVSFHLAGQLQVIVPGQVFKAPTITPLVFTYSFTSGTIGVTSPAAALTDFGVWQLTDPDPAMTYGWWTNSGVVSGGVGGWSFGVSGGSTGFFTVFNAQAQQVYAGQQFTDTNNPNIVFTVTSFGSTAFGFTNVNFTPAAPVPMTTGDTITELITYNRPYAMVVPPLDYPVSGGNYAWRRAAYAALGFSWAAVPNNVSQILTDVQLEYAQTSTAGATTPSPYQRPRQLQVIIKPNRLNYITNPAFGVSASGWGGISGHETVTQDISQFPGNIATINNTPVGTFQSGRATLYSATDSGIQISVPFLIPGDFYICSLYVLPGPGLSDIIASCQGASADLANLIQAQFAYGGTGSAGYGSGPYGGVALSNTPLPTTAWTRMSFSFQATSDTGTLQVSALPVTPTTYPLNFWVTGVLLEPGVVLQQYFDGNSGADTIWEQGGQPGLSRSYYYVQLQFGQGIVTSTLNANTPLGISYATPLYGVPPTQ